jgi:hypothetical protein
MLIFPSRSPPAHTKCNYGISLRKNVIFYLFLEMLRNTIFRSYCVSAAPPKPFSGQRMEFGARVQMQTLSMVHIFFPNSFQNIQKVLFIVNLLSKK